MLHPFYIVDNFVKDPHAAAAMLRLADFSDKVGPDGVTYKRVAQMPSDLFHEEIEAAAKFPVRQDYSIARLNYAGEKPNNAIHADSGYSQYAGIVYLTDPAHCSGGTAFWRHKILGYSEMPDETEVRRTGRNPKQVMKRLSADWNNAAAWEQIDFAPMKFNRAIFFKCKSFHSRFPFEAFGDAPDNGRLIFVSFFSRK